MSDINPFSTEWTWLKSHERLLLVLAFLGVSLYGYHRYLVYRDASDIRKDNLAHAQIQSDAAKNAALAAQVSQQADEYKALAEETNRLNNRLLDTIAARDAAAKQQQQTDQVLPPPQLAARIQVLAPGGSITPQPDATYKVDQIEAQSIVQQLDLIAPLQANLADEKKVTANEGNELNKANGLVTTLNEQVSSLQKTINDTGYVPDKTGQLECQGGLCRADIKVAVDKEAKKHRKWEILLTIAGYVLGRKY